MDTVYPNWNQGTCAHRSNPSLWPASLQPFLAAVQFQAKLLPSFELLWEFSCHRQPVWEPSSARGAASSPGSQHRALQVSVLTQPWEDAHRDQVEISTGEESSETCTLRWTLYPTLLTVLFTTESFNKLWNCGVLSSAEKLYKHFHKSKHERLEFI